MPSEDLAPDWLNQKLACPACHGQLKRNSSSIICIECGAAFPQSDGLLDLLTTSDRALDETWRTRLDECDDWYSKLRESPQTAASTLLADYKPFTSRLARIKGDVLDVGGGNGIPRAYLSDGVRYVSLEPSLRWLDADWALVAPTSPPSPHPPPSSAELRRACLSRRQASTRC